MRLIKETAKFNNDINTNKPKAFRGFFNIFFIEVKNALKGFLHL